MSVHARLSVGYDISTDSMIIRTEVRVGDGGPHEKAEKTHVWLFVAPQSIGGEFVLWDNLKKGLLSMVDYLDKQIEEESNA